MDQEKPLTLTHFVSHVLFSEMMYILCDEQRNFPSVKSQDMTIPMQVSSQSEAGI